jgi:hypothetical protein
MAYAAAAAAPPSVGVITPPRKRKPIDASDTRA